MEAQGKNEAHKNIQSIDHKICNHRAHTILHSYEPAFECHQAEGCRGSPDSDVEIFRREFPYFRGTVDHQEGGLDEYPLDCNQQKCAG